MSSFFSAVPVRSVLRTAVIGSAAVALVLGSAAAASADTGDTSTPDVTTVNVVVGGVIEITGLPASFDMVGTPGAVDTTDVPYTVTTNNTGGYSVTVVAGAADLVPADVAANTDVIPVSSLLVPDETGTLTPMSSDAANPVTIYTQGARSAEAGDQLSSTYQMTIPFVNEDTYSGTLTYLATAL